MYDNDHCQGEGALNNVSKGLKTACCQPYLKVFWTVLGTNWIANLMGWIFQ